MAYKNPNQIIRQCKEEIAKNNKVLATAELSEEYRQTIIADNARIEKIKTKAEKQIESEQV